jgi:pimeloyl-ACP methyl ester carboxylesterase
LRGVVALAPVADLTSARALDVCSDAAVQFLGGPEPEHFEARLPHADPAVLVPTGIATTIVQGATDIVVPPQVAEAFADASAKAGQEIQLTVLDGVGHFPLIDPSAHAAVVVAEEITQLAW